MTDDYRSLGRLGLSLTHVPIRDPGSDYYELVDLTGEAHLSEEECDALEQIAAENDRVLVEHLADKLEARGDTYAAYYLRHVATVEVPGPDAKLRDL